MAKSFIIDCFPDAALKYRKDYVIVVIDVIRATTTATTAVNYGRRVFPVQTTDDAFILAETHTDALLVGELGGHVPYGFHMTNSPVQVTALETVDCGDFTHSRRPIILLSSSGTQLLLNAKGARNIYLGCFRNFTAVADLLASRHDRVALLGAGTRGRFRREDQMGCAWIGDRLRSAGFTAENEESESITERWRDIDPAIVRKGQSADYLKRSGQVHDLEFVIHHIDDLSVVPKFTEGELRPVNSGQP